MKPEKITVPVYQKITLTVEEAAKLSNIGVNKIHELARDPRCNFVLYVGKKKLIKRKEFEQFVSNHIEI